MNTLAAPPNEDLLDRWLANPIFRAAGSAVCRELVTRYPPRSHAADAIVIQEGEPADHLDVLLEGTARIFHRSAAGQELTVKLVRAPMVFGEIQMLHGLAFM